MNDVDKRKVRVEKRISLQLANSSDLKGLWRRNLASLVVKFDSKILLHPLYPYLCQ